MKGANLLNQLNNVKKVDMLPLSNDFVFKRIFGKGGNEKILKSLLEQLQANPQALSQLAAMLNQKQ